MEITAAELRPISPPPASTQARPKYKEEHPPPIQTADPIAHATVGNFGHIPCPSLIKENLIKTKTWLHSFVVLLFITLILSLLAFAFLNNGVYPIIGFTLSGLLLMLTFAGALEKKSLESQLRIAESRKEENPDKIPPSASPNPPPSSQHSGKSSHRPSTQNPARSLLSLAAGRAGPLLCPRRTPPPQVPRLRLPLSPQPTQPTAAGRGQPGSPIYWRGPGCSDETSLSGHRTPPAQLSPLGGRQSAFTSVLPAAPSRAPTPPEPAPPPSPGVAAFCAASSKLGGAANMAAVAAHMQAQALAAKE